MAPLSFCSRRLEKRMQDALSARARTNPKLPKSIDGFLLKFPRIHAVLDRIHGVYDSFGSEHHGGLSLEELQLALRQLEVSVTESELLDIFQPREDNPSLPPRAGGGGESDRVDFGDFLLCLGVLFLLDESNGQTSRFGLREVASALQIIIDGFVFFDEDKDGLLSRGEIETGFGSKKSRKDGSHLRSLSRRLAEMDRDSDGKCTFVEFFGAFVGWVSAQYSDDADGDGDGDGGRDDGDGDGDA